MGNETDEKATRPADLTRGDEYDDPEEEIRRREESSIEERANREELIRTTSYATDATSITRTTTRTSVPAASKKPWYKTPNPLLWGPVPPVPKEKQESREASAGFFSKLTFQWIAPLMDVS